MILFDQLLCNVHNGIIQDEIGFILYERNKYGNITEAWYTGVWFMVGNDYLVWACTIHSVKDGTTYEVIQVSELLEYTRKDVECTFGSSK